MSDDHLTPKTKFSADLKTVVAMLGTIVAGSVIAGGTYMRMKLALERLETSEADRALKAVTKADLAEERKHTARMIRKTLGFVRVKCPQYVIKGQTHVICEIVSDPRGGNNDEAILEDE